jgi:hypothetical protein
MTKLETLACRVFETTGLRADSLRGNVANPSCVNVYSPDNRSRLQVGVSFSATAEDYAAHERTIVAAVKALGWSK